MNPYILKKHPNKFVKFFEENSPEIPAELYEAECVKPDLADFPLPLPSKKKDYTCFVKTADGAFWYGAKTGLTRYDANAENIEDRVQYFCADRYLYDNEVERLLADGNKVWVKTKTGIVSAEMISLSSEEKANMLLRESMEIVDRRGMISHRRLYKARDLSSKYHDNECDNDGGFTSAYAIGELFHYATLKREKGEDDEETQFVKAAVTRAVESVLLLFYLPGRGDGFFARTYMAPGERLPDGGLFFERKGNKAYVVENPGTIKKGLAGKSIDCSAPIPERLKHLYTDEGFTEDGLIYKGDTSSDEVTLNYACMRYAHQILGPTDPELDEIIKDAIKNTTYHFIDNDYQLIDFEGKPTSWAKWNLTYFSSDLGWSDGALNAAEMMFYLYACNEVLGGDEKCKNAVKDLLEKGYSEIATKHNERFYKASMAEGMDLREDLMYGDHMLAVISFWQLCDMEKDEKLLECWKKGFRSWQRTLSKEHSPCYDFPYILATGDTVDMQRSLFYFLRCPSSRLASGITLNREDYPLDVRFSTETRELSSLLPADERFIAKYDRNPMADCREDSGGMYCVESCAMYTFAYWIGRYFGIIKEEE